MRHGDKVYILNDDGKDSGIHGEIHDVKVFTNMYIYSVAIDGDKNNIINVNKYLLRKKERTYQVGDKFKIKSLIHSHGYYFYTLIPTGHYKEVNLVSNDKTNNWSNPIKVDDKFKIKESEISEVIGPFTWELME